MCHESAQVALVQASAWSRDRVVGQLTLRHCAGACLIQSMAVVYLPYLVVMPHRLPHHHTSRSLNIVIILSLVMIVETPSS
jgi:hypothetical protein